MLDGRGRALASQAVDGEVFPVGVLTQHLNQLLYLRLARGAKLDRQTELGNELTDAIMLQARSFRFGRVAGLHQWQEILLLELHMRHQPLLEVVEG
jgi:hypothetical protein